MYVLYIQTVYQVHCISSLFSRQVLYCLSGLFIIYKLYELTFLTRRWWTPVIVLRNISSRLTLHSLQFLHVSLSHGGINVETETSTCPLVWRLTIFLLTPKIIPGKSCRNRSLLQPNSAPPSFTYSSSGLKCWLNTYILPCRIVNSALSSLLIAVIHLSHKCSSFMKL